MPHVTTQKPPLGIIILYHVFSTSGLIVCEARVIPSLIENAAHDNSETPLGILFFTIFSRPGVCKFPHRKPFDDAAGHGACDAVRHRVPDGTLGGRSSSAGRFRAGEYKDERSRGWDWEEEVIRRGKTFSWRFGELG